MEKPSETRKQSGDTLQGLAHTYLQLVQLLQNVKQHLLQTQTQWGVGNTPYVQGNTCPPSVCLHCTGLFRTTANCFSCSEEMITLPFPCMGLSRSSCKLGLSTSNAAAAPASLGSGAPSAGGGWGGGCSCRQGTEGMHHTPACVHNNKLMSNNTTVNNTNKQDVSTRRSLPTANNRYQYQSNAKMSLYKYHTYVHKYTRPCHSLMWTPIHAWPAKTIPSSAT